MLFNTHIIYIIYYRDITITQEHILVYTLLTFPVVFLKKTTFLGVFENIIGCFSILQPKMR
jgi:hypothetical protein